MYYIQLCTHIQYQQYTLSNRYPSKGFLTRTRLLLQPHKEKAGRYNQHIGTCTKKVERIKSILHLYGTIPDRPCSMERCGIIHQRPYFSMFEPLLLSVYSIFSSCYARSILPIKVDSLELSAAHVV